MKKTFFLNCCFILAALIPLGVLLSVFFFSQPNDLRQPVSEEKAGAVSTAVVEGAQSPFAPTVIPLQERVTMKPPLDDEDLPQELSTLDGLKDAPTLEDNQEDEASKAAPKDDDSFLDLNMDEETADEENGDEESADGENADPLTESSESEEESGEKALGPDGLVLDRPSRDGSDPNQKFDPVKENGEFFVGWEKPKVTLVLTGRLNGYLEPCGCAGMDRMTGGLSRQCEFFGQLKEKGWNPLILDVGGISPGVTKQAQLKFLAAVNMLREMGYDAITLGTIDLNFPCADILAEVSNPGVSGKLFTSANVGLFEFDNELLPPAKIVSRNGVKIGIIGVLGDEECEQVKKQNDEVVVRSAKLVLAKLVPMLKEQCQFIVLLSHATIEESKEFAKEFPDIDIIVTPNGPPVPPAEPEIIPETGQYFITIGEKGMNVLVLGLYDDDEEPLLYQRVSMDSRFPSSEKILNLMGIYQEQLRLEGLEGLGIQPLRNPFEKSNGEYVGSKRCESCHEESYKVWKTSRHSIAWKSLEKSNPPRTFDPECIACHVEGWNAEHRMPFKSGFLGVDVTPDLINVGCESCHGPGEKHMQAEIGSNEKLQEKYREALHLDASDKEKMKVLCIQCHDLDNSPKFDYERYYKVIEHHESE
ncbi:MAG: hypothetical protein IJQ31_10810 [Thermoguttaceae bacterium]|nr:hypothetical protein [Thermoguttaceae bacterium]